MTKTTFLRAVAIFFIIEILGTTIWPTITYALTAGPTSPEATSFEPVDTTDMVNPLTGDLTYNIPLLEVPGPSGGYPLSLSYHAGIMPNEEASWVGLGWTLNTGAINRNVNGFADDHENVPNIDRTYWEGGTRRSGSVGVSVGIPGTPASVSAGIEVGDDTYQGFGVGMYAGAGVTFLGGNEGDKSSLGLNATVGVDPWGNAYGSAGLGAGIGKAGQEGLKLSLGVGVSTNFKTVSGYASGGVSYSSKKVGGKHDGANQSQSLLGASISTGGGLKPSLSVGGGSAGVSNGKSGNISTKSGGFNLPIPIAPGVFVNLGYKYNRYWMDEVVNVATNGALYYPDTEISDWTYFEDNAFDTYSLLDPDLEGGIVDNPDPKQVMGGSFPNVDNYSVNAQGLMGNIKPHFFKKHLTRQVEQHKEGDNTRLDIIPHTLGYDNTPVEFRFINDFSNQYQYDPLTGFVKGTPTLLDFDFDGTALTGENGDDGIENNHLAGSKHIEYLTNEAIFNDNKIVTTIGFVETKTSGFTRDDNSQIGAYVITNESGVKYHFALPAYASDEFQYSENIERGTGHTFNSLRRPEKYAYTWLLTAITGPDFVDRGVVGVLDPADWGYWVEFDYGKWTDQYAWRTPEEGMEKDLDNNYQNFTEGIKELYYLDAVKTKTHTALFVKDIRDDAKSALRTFKHSDAYWVKFLTEAALKYSVTDDIAQGGFIPQELTYEVDYIEPTVVEADHNIAQVSKPVSSLKLDKVILLQNEDATQIKSLGNQFHQSITYNDRVYKELNESTFTEVQQHLPDNVLDTYDVISAGLEDKALRVIEMDTDYSLAPETMNSYNSNLLLGSGSPSLSPSSYANLSGKLTLNSLKFLGKGGADMIPPMNFEYDLPSESLPIDLSGEIVVDKSYKLQEGDIIKYSSGGKTYYKVIYDYNFVAGSRQFKSKFIGAEDSTTAFRSTSAQRTKNPPYNKDAYDIWGMYKSDFSEAICELGENLARSVSDISAKSKDVYSLRAIDSSTGARISIEYKSDIHHAPKLQENVILSIKDIENIDGKAHIIIHGNASLSEADLESLKHLKLSTYLLWGTGYNWTNGVNSCGAPISGTSNNFKYNPIYYPDLSISDIQIVNEEIRIIHDRPITFNRQDESGTIFSHYANVYDCNGTVYANYINECPEGGAPDVSNCAFYKTATYSPSNLLSGNIVIGNKEEDFLLNGGNIAVESIGLSTQNNLIKTNYIYENGITSYEPVNFGSIVFDIPSNSFYNDTEEVEKAKKYHKKLLYAFFSNLLANSREIPAPGVMYGHVKIEESVIHEDGTEEYLPSYSVYEFETFDKGMVNIGRTIPTPPEDLSNDLKEYYGDGPQVIKYHDVLDREVKLKDYTTQVGNLKSITLYNRDNNQKITETINHYLHDRNDETDVFEHNRDIYEPLLESRFSSQGVIEETFSEARFVRYKDGDRKHKRDLMGVITKRETFPSIQTGQTNINYKTGITSKSMDLAFDFYSGQVTKSLSTDGYGNHYISEVTPAYRKYPGMGLSILDGTNMLTQTASSVSYKIDNEIEQNPMGLVSASVQTWNDGTPLIEQDNQEQVFTLRHISTDDGVHVFEDIAGNSSLLVGDQIKFPMSFRGKYFKGKVVTALSGNRFEIRVWGIEGHLVSGATWGDHEVTLSSAFKKRASYSWIGDDDLRDDGLFDYGRFDEFTGWTSGVANALWQKNGEITLYDTYSHALEASDVNGKFAATKMDSKQEVVLATVANARYDEFAYSGAEDDLISSVFGGGVTHAGTISTASAHTGAYSVNVATAGGEAFRYTATTSQDRKMYASVWSSRDDGKIKYKINGGAEQVAILKPVRSAENWHLLRTEIPGIVANDQVQISTEATTANTYFDDFRVHPIDAAMTSYVYNDWGELSHILDANNLYTEYRYDGMGRLSETHRETFQSGVQKVAKTEYNYARTLLDKIDQLNADFTIASNRIVNQSIGFTAPSQTVLEGGTSYHWYFDDGSESSSTNPNHTFTTTGSHSTKLIVENPQFGGKESVQGFTVYTGHPEFTICVDGPTYLDICEVDPVQFGGCTSDENDQSGAKFKVIMSNTSRGACPVESFTWTYDGGQELGTGSTSEELNFTAVGVYQITCEAIDECGETITQMISITIDKSFDCGDIEQ